MAGAALTKLLSALTQAFSVIAIGYVAALSGFVSADAARGIGQLVGKIALPCLLFRAVATTDLSSVNLLVVIAVVISKYLCLFTAATVGYLKNKGKKEAISIAGSYAMFVTNSNDLAIGIPLAQALYPMEDNPEGPNVSYIYVFAVFQIVLVAPTVFGMLELGNLQMQDDGGKGQAKNQGSVVGNVLRSLVRNPLIICAFLGLFYNITLGTELPYTIDRTLRLIGNAFACGALFTTGMGSVGQTSAMSGKGLVMPIFLSLTISLLRPIVGRYLTVALCSSSMSPDQLDTFINFVFLYSAIPTAASTPVICQQFIGHLPDLFAMICGASVLNLVLSAPLMVMCTVVFGEWGAPRSVVQINIYIYVLTHRLFCVHLELNQDSTQQMQCQMPPPFCSRS